MNTLAHPAAELHATTEINFRSRKIPLLSFALVFCFYLYVLRKYDYEGVGPFEWFPKSLFLCIALGAAWTGIMWMAREVINGIVKYPYRKIRRSWFAKANQGFSARTSGALWLGYGPAFGALFVSCFVFSPAREKVMAVDGERVYTYVFGLPFRSKVLILDRESRIETYVFAQSKNGAWVRGEIRAVFAPTIDTEKWAKNALMKERAENLLRREFRKAIEKTDLREQSSYFRIEQAVSKSSGLEKRGLAWGRSSTIEVTSLHVSPGSD